MTQISELDGCLDWVFTSKLIRFLRDELPDETQQFSDDQLAAQINVSDSHAIPLGIESDLGRVHAAILTLLYGVEPWSDPDFLKFLAARNDPEEQLEAFLEWLPEQVES